MRNTDAPEYPMAQRCPFGPPPALAELQAGERIRLWNGDEPWLVTGYQVGRARSCPTRAPAPTPTCPGARMTARPAVARRKVSKTVIHMDDQEHSRLFTRDFMVKRGEALRPRIQDVVDGLTGGLLAGSKPIDLVQALALPLPSMMISEMLGVPYSERVSFNRLSQVDASRSATSEQVPPASCARTDLVNVCGLLLIAGHETTTNIPLGTLNLLRHPDVLAKVRAADVRSWSPTRPRTCCACSPSSTMDAAESPCRTWRSPRHIQAGEGVIAALDIGNRDPHTRLIGGVMPRDSPVRQVLRLALPAIGVLAAEPLYLLVDTAVVGHLGAIPLAALAVAGTVLAQVSTQLGVFLSLSTTARSARLHGAGRRPDAVGEGVQATWLAATIGVVVVIIGQLVAGPVIRLLAGPGDVADIAVGWLRIALLGVPFILITVSGNGWMRGIQDTTRPLRYVLAGNGISAVLCPVLVHGADLGLAGSAIANVTAQVIAAGLFVRALVTERVPLRPAPPTMRAQLGLGRHFALRTVAFQACFISATAIAVHTSPAAAGAHQIVLQLWFFAALTLHSLAIAAQSLVGAALGAGNGPRARELAARITRYGLLFGALLGSAFAALYGVLPRAFTTDGSVLAEIPNAWWFFIVLQPIGGVVFALEGVLVGAGDAVFMRNATVGAVAFGFLPLVWASLAFGWGLLGIWFALTVFVVIRLIAMLARLRSGRWAVPGAESDLACQGTCS